MHRRHSISEIAVQPQLMRRLTDGYAGHSISEIAVQPQPEQQVAEKVRSHSISEIAVQPQRIEIIDPERLCHSISEIAVQPQPAGRALQVFVRAPRDAALPCRLHDGQGVYGYFWIKIRMRQSAHCIYGYLRV